MKRRLLSSLLVAMTLAVSVPVPVYASEDSKIVGELDFQLDDSVFEEIDSTLDGTVRDGLEETDRGNLESWEKSVKKTNRGEKVRGFAFKLLVAIGGTLLIGGTYFGKKKKDRRG